jgi:hypothetical protein
MNECKLEILHAKCYDDIGYCKFYNKNMADCNLKSLLAEIYMENKNKTSRNLFIGEALNT